MRRWLTPEGAMAASVSDLELIASVHPYDMDGDLRVLFYPMKQDIHTAKKDLSVEASWFEGGQFLE
jgi:hypothetical protein